MADTLLTVADVLFNAFDVSDADVSDLRQDAVLVPRMPAEPSSNGTVHKYVKRVTAPTVGWRSVNAGRFMSKSGDQTVTANLTCLDFSWDVDAALIDGAARRGGPEAIIAREGLAHVGAALFAYETQLINGTINGDAAGFSGFANALSALTNKMVVDAGGDAGGVGGNTSGNTSLYAIRLGRNDCTAVFNGDQTIELSPSVMTKNLDGSSKSYGAWFTEGHAWLGLQVGGAYSIGRIANIDEDHPLTDDLVATLLSRFPAGRRPNLLVCNPAGQELLRQSRTATNPTGTPAPLPEDVFGIPLAITDAVLNTEGVIS